MSVWSGMPWNCGTRDNRQIDFGSLIRYVIEIFSPKPERKLLLFRAGWNCYKNGI